MPDNQNTREKIMPTILLVDDRSDNLLTLEAILSSLDVAIVTKSSGEEALAFLEGTSDVALVVLDVQMPGLSGFETADLMHKNEKLRFIPIIFATAISKEEQFVAKGYEVGAVDYMHKPLNPAVVRSKVKVFADMHRQKIMLAKYQDVMLRKRFDSSFTQFINGIAHNFNNILAGIRGYGQLVEMSPGNVDLAVKAGAQILESVDKMTDMVKSLRDLAVQDDAGQKEFNLREEVEALMVLLRPSISKRINFVEQSPLDVDVEASNLDFRKAFHNMLSNAIEAISESSQPEMSVDYALEEHMVVIGIVDNGRGMDEQGIEDALVPLFSTKNTVGVGMGLPLTKSFLEGAGGSLNIESHVGMGTRVEMRLPTK